MNTSTQRWVLIATILGSALVFIDGTAVNVALPVLQRSLGATISEAQWIVESYALFLAALLLVGGTLGDRYGRRKIYAIGVVLFAISSIWCSVAPDALQLILARGLQGIGGALLVPGSLAIITASFPKETRGKAIGTWSAFSAIMAVIGPLLGGWLVDTVSWRAVFLINIPLCAIVLFLLFWKVPESRDDEAPDKLDWPGILLVTPGLGILVYGLIEANNSGITDPFVLAVSGTGLALLIGFLLVESRSSAPMMPLSVFRSKTFSGANLLTLMVYSALSGLMFFLSFNLIQIQGYSATEAGASLIPFVVLISTLSRWAGGLVDKIGAKIPLVVGPTITAVGYVLFALPGIGGSYWSTIFPASVVMGIGMAITVAPLTTTVMNAVDQRHAGLASGINNAVSRLAALLAIAVLGIVAVNTFGTTLGERLAELKLPEAIIEQVLAQTTSMAAIELPDGLQAESREAVQLAINESFIASYKLVAWIAAGLTLAGGLFALLMIDGKVAEKTEGAAEMPLP